MTDCKLLYVSNTENVHDIRFVRMLSSDFVVVVVSQEKLLEWNLEADLASEFCLVFVVGLNLKLPTEITSGRMLLIGVSLGFDINLAVSDGTDLENVIGNVRKMDAIVLDNAYSVIQLNKLRINPLPNFLVTPYGADIENYQFNATCLEDQLAIVVTRSWSELHANMDIVAAMRLLQKPSKIYFLGVTNPQSKAAVNDLSLDGIHEVHSLGPVTPDQIPEILDRGWCYVSASRSDGTSVSLLEALAAGKICVVTDFPSNLEWITHGVNGFVFKNGDPASLASILESISEMKLDELVEIAVRARETVTSRGNWNLNSEKIMKFLRGLLAV